MPPSFAKTGVNRGRLSRIRHRSLSRRQSGSGVLWLGAEYFRCEGTSDCFVKIAPSPRPVNAEERAINPDEEGFSGFVFKIHANMDPNHRSCIAFVKVCSGKFERNAPYKHVRSGKTMKFAAPDCLHGTEKEYCRRGISR